MFQAHQAGGSHVTGTDTILLYLYLSVAYIAGTTTAGVIIIQRNPSCSISRLYLLAASSGICGLVLLTATALDGYRGYTVFSWCYGFFYGMMEFARMSYTNQIVPAGAMDKCWGIVHLVQFFPSLLGAPITEQINVTSNVKFGYIFSGSFVLLSSLILYLFPWFYHCYLDWLRRKGRLPADAPLSSHAEYFNHTMQCHSDSESPVNVPEFSPENIVNQLDSPSSNHHAVNCVEVKPEYGCHCHYDTTASPSTPHHPTNQQAKTKASTSLGGRVIKFLDQKLIELGFASRLAIAQEEVYVTREKQNHAYENQPAVTARNEGNTVPLHEQLQWELQKLQRQQEQQLLLSEEQRQKRQQQDQLQMQWKAIYQLQCLLHQQLLHNEQVQKGRSGSEETCINPAAASSPEGQQIYASPTAAFATTSSQETGCAHQYAVVSPKTNNQQNKCRHCHRFYLKQQKQERELPASDSEEGRERHSTPLLPSRACSQCGYMESELGQQSQKEQAPAKARARPSRSRTRSKSPAGKHSVGRNEEDSDIDTPSAERRVEHSSADSPEIHQKTLGLGRVVMPIVHDKVKQISLESYTPPSLASSNVSSMGETSESCEHSKHRSPDTVVEAITTCL